MGRPAETNNKPFITFLFFFFFLFVYYYIINIQHNYYVFTNHILYSTLLN